VSGVRASLVILLAGCIQQPPPESDLPPPPPDDGWTGPTGDPIDACFNTCGTLVCARDGLCYPPEDIHAIHVSWTVGGAPANVSTCAGTPDLAIGFADDIGVWLGFAPVLCRGGRFTVDKAPRTYTRVELGPQGTSSPTSALIDDAGDALIDLP